MAECCTDTDARLTAGVRACQLEYNINLSQSSSYQETLLEMMPICLLPVTVSLFY